MNKAGLASRRRLQIHLSTSILVALLTGGLLGANLLGLGYNTVNNENFHPKAGEVMVYNQLYGFPLRIKRVMKVQGPHGVWRSIDSGPQSLLDKKWFYNYVPCFLLILLSTVLFEFLIRRKESE